MTERAAGLEVDPGVDEPGEPAPPMTVVVQPATGRLALSL
jgi:hypothetical protein